MVKPKYPFKAEVGQDPGYQYDSGMESEVSESMNQPMIGAEGDEEEDDVDMQFPGRNASFCMLYFATFVDMLGYGLILPAFPIIAIKYGANGFKMGVLNSSYSTAQMIGSIVCGMLSDSGRIGRRPILLFSLFGSILALMGLGFCDSYWSLFIVRTIDGGMSATVGTAQAYIADMTKPKERAKYMGLIGASTGLGVVLGPFIGGVMYSHYGFAITCWVAASISAVNFVLAFFLLKENPVVLERKAIHARMKGSKVKQEGSFKLVADVIKRDKNIIFVFLAFCFAQAGYVVFQTVYALYAVWKFQIDALDLAYVFAGFGGAMIIAQILFTGVSTKFFGERLTVMVGSILRGAFLALVIYMPSNKLTTLCVMAIAVSGALVQPCLTAMVAMFSDKKTHGAILSINQLLGAFARGVAPLIAGVVYDINKDWSWYYCGAGSMILTFLVLIPCRMPIKDTQFVPPKSKKIVKTPLGP